MGNRREPEKDFGIELKSDDDESEDTSYFKEESSAPEGSRGWLIIVTTFSLTFVAAGMRDSLSVIRKSTRSHSTPVQEKILHYTFMYLALLMGPFASALAEKFGVGRTIMSGSILATVGMILSLVTSADFYSLLFGFCIFGGIGVGIMSTLTVVIVGLYFDKNRPIAIGVTLAGAFLQNTWMTPIPQMIVDSGVWQGALWWSTALCALSTFLPMMAFPQKSNRTVKLQKGGGKMPILQQLRELLTSPSYLIFSFSCFLFIVGFHLSLTPALYRATSFSSSVDFVVVNKIGGVTWLISFVVFALLANQFGNSLRMSNVMLTISGVLVASCSFSNQVWAAIAYLVATGLYSGIYMSLRPLIVMDIAKEKKLNMGVGLAHITILIALLVLQILHETVWFDQRMHDTSAYVGVGLLFLAAGLGFSLARIQICEEKRKGLDGSWKTPQTSLQTNL